MKKIIEFKNLFRANKVFISYIYRHGKLMLILQVFVILLSIPLNFIQLYAPKKFIDTIFNATYIWESMKWIIYLVFIEVLFFVISNFFALYRQYVCNRAKLYAKEDTLRHFMDLYISYYDDMEKQNKLQRALEYIENGGLSFVLFLISLLTTITSFSVVTYISLQFDWWFWIIIVSLFIVKLLLQNKIKILNFKFQQEKTIRNRKINYFSNVLTSKETLPEIKIYNSYNFFLKMFRNEYLDNQNKQMKFDIKMMVIYVLELISNKIFDLIAYLIIGFRLLNKSATIGDYTLFFAMINQINMLLNNFKGNVCALYEHALAAKNYCEFIDDTSHIIQISHNEEKINEIFSLEMCNVGYSYANQAFEALKDINFNIKQGERVSIVGLNGAGKTTLIKLILRLYKPNCGNIFINGKNALEIDLESYYSRIGVVFQNHQEYAITLSQNINFNDDSSNEKDDILAILKKVNLYDKIVKLPDGIDTPLTYNYYKNGIDLSGGERQKLAVARAIYKNCDLFIFDEPSSALDAEAENDLFEFINSIPKNKSIIFISHRLSSSIMADRIIVLKEGKIIANDSHQELIKTCDEYRKMYDLQSKRYR